MILLAYVIGLLSLAAGTGLVIVALLRLETRERDGFVSKGVADAPCTPGHA